MSNKNDLIAALSHRQPTERVPIWELGFHGWDAMARESRSGRHMVLGEEMAKLTEAQQDRALHANAELIVAASRKLHYAAVTTPNSYWYQAPGDLAYYILPGETRWKQIEILRKIAGDELLLVGNSGGVIGASYDEEFCDHLYNQPEKIDELCRRRLEGGLKNAQRMADLGIDVVFSASDIGDNSGPFFNPAQMQRFILPYLDQWAQACKAMGLFTILHSDGQLTPYIDAIAATAVDGLQAIDPVAGMDIAQVKRIAGDRLCLCGNVDCGLLLRGTPETIYAATRQLLETCKADGNLVLGASNIVQREVPLANYHAMIEAWKAFGSYGKPCGRAAQLSPGCSEPSNPRESTICES